MGFGSKSSTSYTKDRDKDTRDKIIKCSMYTKKNIGKKEKKKRKQTFTLSANHNLHQF